MQTIEIWHSIQWK